MYHRQFPARAHIVAMHCDIDHPGVDISFVGLANETRDSARNLHTAGRNPREYHSFEVRVSLDDLVRNPA